MTKGFWMPIMAPKETLNIVGLAGRFATVAWFFDAGRRVSAVSWQKSLVLLVFSYAVSGVG